MSCSRIYVSECTVAIVDVTGYPVVELRHQGVPFAVLDPGGFTPGDALATLRALWWELGHELSAAERALRLYESLGMGVER